MYVVRNDELYTGPMPTFGNHDWFSAAKRVGRYEWNNYAFLFFHPTGLLYVVTKGGELYKGPAPHNENLSWIYRQATLIGRSKWNEFKALCFNPYGHLFGVTNTDRLVGGNPPANADVSWLLHCQQYGSGGWITLSKFLGFTPDNSLWCVNKDNGNIYKGPLPGTDPSYLNRAQMLGWNYNKFKFLALTNDKTIQTILNFEFLPESGKILSQSNEVVEEKIYDNRKSSSTLNHTFTFNKTLTESSEFAHDHGFSVASGIEVTFKGGIPHVAEGGLSLSVKTTTTHNWKFNEKNETQVTFSTSTSVELEGGKAIRIVASVMKAKMDVPYRANVRTIFGNEVVIHGTWRGSRHYNLKVSQEDYTK
ncbi:uncharacterized protein WCC33_003288 [Rhinophrynus dorsalis]